MTVARLNDGKIFKRHPDDIKLQVPNYQEKSIETGSEENASEEWQQIRRRYFPQDEDEVYSDLDIAPEEENAIHVNGRTIPRRSTRRREPIIRYPDMKHEALLFKKRKEIEKLSEFCIQGSLQFDC